MVHHNYSGGLHIVEELAYCNMKIGAPPYYAPSQLPIKSGAAEHLPACVLGLSDFEDVSIDAIKEWGVNFEMYSAVKPGKCYIFSRKEPTGIKHYWSSPALVAGGFIYRPKSGTNCFEDNCAKIGFKCRGHNHFFLCEKTECVATKSRFATGSARAPQLGGPSKMYVCPMCRTEHRDFA